jgi:pyruvate dehydrogenase E1 component
MDKDIGMRDQMLEEIQDRVLWLATYMIHHANVIRPNTDGIKVGGHQTSSASSVTLLTSLFFDLMNPGDRICVKPHAGPVFHAIQYLMGNLDKEYMETLRGFHGLQSYPSRTKDPDSVDFSGGSMGLGVIAPNFASLTDEYLVSHEYLPKNPSHRYIATVGDAELDEGSVWEAIIEPQLSTLSNLMWVVDLNRQSLDRIIPGIRVQMWADMFAANGWEVIEAKYGMKLQNAFAQPKGELLRNCIDEMSNEVYQRLLRVPSGDLRELLPGFSRDPKAFTKFIGQWDDVGLRDLFQNLGGHDFKVLREAYRRADEVDRPSVVFAYTMKGWRLPSMGDPQNHSVVMSKEAIEELRQQLNIDEQKPWSGFDPKSEAGRFCIGVGERYRSYKNKENGAINLAVPETLGHSYSGEMSTQQAFGVILTDVARDIPKIAEKIVTVSPDVASTTNLGGWINKAGVWSREEKPVLPAEEILRSLKWEENPKGRHIELGISENNLFMLLGQLGLSSEMFGELLFPIGAVYDQFICRALDAFMFNMYSGSRFITVGTPSGITLSPEGGAHQSTVTQGIGIEIPDLTFYEPCFAQELEWILLHALEQVRIRKESAYIRLSTRKINQDMFVLPSDEDSRESLRRQVLNGAYRIVDQSGNDGYKPGVNVVNLFASGVMVADAIQASRFLVEEGLFANVINITSPDRLFRWHMESVAVVSKHTGQSTPFLSGTLTLEEMAVPTVTVLDGHPHSLAWIGSALGTKSFPLGVSGFGQSGGMNDLYKEYGIDVDSIIETCFGALEGFS